MSDSIKKEARKQYFHYFRIWFIVIGVLFVIAVIAGAAYTARNTASRPNLSAPAERVYDYADVLTDAEENNLRQRIAEVERELHIDIVLVTFNQSVEGEDAMRQYGFRSTDWEQNMMDYADDFWDENRYGYNKGYEGDGCILVHNWYEGQNGEHLSTSGRVEERFSVYDIDDVLYAVDKYYETDPYRAYLAYVNRVAYLMSTEDATPLPFAVIFILPLIAALVYALINLRQKAAQDTTTASTYVEGGKPVMKAQADDFIRKNVVTRRIESSSGGGSTRSHSGGGGGHHTSSSGASHGGGSHRH